jgi:cell fate regulator YaaT (PSP1 superfamily)
MGCSGCSTGTGVPAGCNNNGACGTGGCNKLNVFDWLSNMRLPEGQAPFDIIEVRFKNSRKEFYRNVNSLSLNVGDPIAVEAQSGHDIGTVSLTGELVKLQLKKKRVNFDSAEIRKIYRKAKQADIDKWREAQALETDTMFKARTIALRLGLEMKLSDVEYQGDKSKAVFYYTADARVDFRELIKVLAEEFRIRIEMRQIGARQEASRLGGIGSCGRELCCSTWLTDYRTVNTSAARYQQLSLNPLKLAGQCGKLKCCLNYELDSYVDALKEFPEMEGKKLLTKKGDAFLQKTDIFGKMMWFSYRSDPGVFIPLTTAAVKKILEDNANGIVPEALEPSLKVAQKITVAEHTFENVVGQDSLTRFDKKKQGNKNRRNNQRRPEGNKQKSEQAKTGEVMRAPNPGKPGNSGKPANQPKPQKPRNFEPRKDQKRNDNRRRNNNKPGNQPNPSNDKPES